MKYLSIIYENYIQNQSSKQKKSLLLNTYISHQKKTSHIPSRQIHNPLSKPPRLLLPNRPIMLPLHPPNEPQQINARQNPKHTRRRSGDDQGHFAGLD